MGVNFFGSKFIKVHEIESINSFDIVSEMSFYFKFLFSVLVFIFGIRVVKVVLFSSFLGNKMKKTERIKSYLLMFAEIEHFRKLFLEISFWKQVTNTILYQVSCS